MTNLNDKEFDPTGLFDNEEDIVNIDTDRIDTDAVKEASELVENLKEIYSDSEFMKNNPKFATRLKSEVENVRILLKIRKSDEIAHDVLLGAIGRNSDNASLYRSLSDIQKTILSTTSELSSKIKDINSMLKAIQLEFNFNQRDVEVTETTQEQTPDQTTFRGSKDFIKQMRQELDDDAQ